MFWSQERGEPLTYTSGGQETTLPPAVTVPDTELLWAVHDAGQFATWAGVPHGVLWAKAETLRRAYCRSQGLLVDVGANDRLAAVLIRYGEEIEVDLAYLDITALWQARRWRRLRNLLDHLPNHSHYMEAILSDPDMVELIARRQHESKAGGGKKGGYLIAEYTPEIRTLTQLGNDLRALRATIVAVNSKGGKAPRVEPYPGPVTAMDEVNVKVRLEKHRELTNRFLARNQDIDEKVE